MRLSRISQFTRVRATRRADFASGTPAVAEDLEPTS